VAAATAIAISAAPANASVYYYGSTTSANATSSMTTHVVSVTPVVTLMPGYTSQQVQYEVAVQDVTYGTTAPFGYYPWQGPWTANSLITAGSNCNQLNQTGCNPIYGPVTLPTARFTGLPSHTYAVWVRAAFLASNGWYTSPWTHVESCRTYYVTNGISNSVETNNCWT
jgi:hypothetical protein